MESFQSITERVQDMVRVLQDLTPEEQKEVLNCFTKCLRSDEELKDLEQRVRGPRKKRAERGRGQWGTIHSDGTGLLSPISWS